MITAHGHRFTSSLTDVPLDQIDFTNRRKHRGEHTEPRASIIEGIKESLATGKRVPAPVVYVDPDGPYTYRVLDGNTRLTAHHEHGSRTIRVHVVPTEEAEAFWDELYSPEGE